MSFTIQHPTSGLSWASNEDGQIILSSATASTYITIENGYTQNISSELCVRSLGSTMYETGYYGAIPEFGWSVNDDGSVYSEFNGPQWVGEDLTASAEPFFWKKVPVKRAAALLAAASAPAPVAEPVPINFSSEV